MAVGAQASAGPSFLSATKINPEEELEIVICGFWSVVVAGAKH